MYAVKRLDGSTDFNIMDFKISATVAQDQALIAEVADTGGGVVKLATTTSLVDMIGTVLGAATGGSLTYSATQGDTEGLVRVCINPDAIFRARMCGGATAGTSLQTVTVTSANTAGTTMTSTDTQENDMDDGTIWCLSGNNLGLSRRITTFTANTSAVVTVPFPRTLAVGDTFTCVPYSPLVTIAIQLTSNFQEADATIAYGTGGTARPLELILNGVADSYVHFIARDHALNELS